MLCPVCNKRPLTGRQTTCSAKCRSAKYRARKQKQRDASTPVGSGQFSPKTQRPHRSTKGPDLERLVSTAADRIIAAIQQLATSRAVESAAQRIDICEQVTSQAPEGAVGYRLLLPSRGSGDAPRLSPRRSRSRPAAMYSLSPFEYPDDLRLCDGCWYRIVWIDAQGGRMRLQLGEEIPALYYFLGAHEPMSREKRIDEVMRLADQAEAESSQLCGEESSPSVQQTASATSVLATIPSALLTGTTEGDRAILSTMPPLASDESRVVLRFVQQPEWLIQLLHEDRVATSEAAGQPMPPEPPTSLSHDERQAIRGILKQKQPRPFVRLCMLLYTLARRYGPEAMTFLPTALPRLPDADVERMRSAVADPKKRAYLEYLRAHQEALLQGLPPPTGPTVTITGKEGQQLRRAMRDTRQVTLFEDLTLPRLTGLDRCASRSVDDCDTT